MPPWMDPAQQNPLQVETKAPELEQKEELVAPKLECKKEKLAESKPIFTVDIASMQVFMHSPSSDAVEGAPLEAGPNGLLVARFADRVHTTELCNLMLAAAPKRVMKRPAAAMIAKRRAAKVAVEAPVADVPAVVPAAAAGPKNDYGFNYYKNHNSIGIKAKFGACNQVFSFGGTKCTKTEEQLRAIAAQIVADLHEGVSEADAKKKGVELAWL